MKKAEERGIEGGEREGPVAGAVCIWISRGQEGGAGRGVLSDLSDPRRDAVVATSYDATHQGLV